MNDEELIAKMDKLAIEIEEDKKANPEKYSMVYIPISRLEEAAEKHSESVLSDLYDDSERDFKAGALWLLEQARKLAYTEPNGMATEEIAFYEQLEELCQSEHKGNEQ